MVSVLWETDFYIFHRYTFIQLHFFIIDIRKLYKHLYVSNVMNFKQATSFSTYYCAIVKDYSCCRHLKNDMQEVDPRHVGHQADVLTTVRTLREDQPLRLLLNLLFYHFNHSESTSKSQRIKLLDVIAACNQIN